MVLWIYTILLNTAINKEKLRFSSLNLHTYNDIMRLGRFYGTHSGAWTQVKTFPDRDPQSPGASSEHNAVKM